MQSTGVATSDSAEGGNGGAVSRGFQQLLSLIMPEGASRRIRYGGIQIVCLVMVWFFVQGSGNPQILANPADAEGPLFALGRLSSTGSQCAGGIVGSLFILIWPRLRSRLPGDFSAGDGSSARQLQLRLSLGATALLAVLLAGGLWSTATGDPVITFVLRMAASALITALFLNACLTMVGLSMATILAVFLLVALCRIVQNLMMLPFTGGFAWNALSVAVELGLLAAYVATLLKMRAEPEAPEAASSPNSAKTIADRPAASTSPEGIPSPTGSRDDVSAEPTASTGREPAKRLLPWQFIVHVMLYYFVVGVLGNLGGHIMRPGFETNCTYLLASGLAFLLYYLSFARTGNTTDYWVRIRQIAFPLLVSSCALTALVPTAWLFIPFALGQIGYRYFLLSSYVEMFSICDITDVNARHVFAVTHIVMYVGIFCGNVVGLAMRSDAVTNPATVLAMTLLLFLCLTAASCWLGNDKSAGKVWGRRIELTPKGRQDRLLSETYASIAETYGLTAKETEILEHLVRKQTLDQIAATLVVSKNTVRTHVRNLYAKVGAHSQSDVYRLFDETKRTTKR